MARVKHFVNARKKRRIVLKQALDYRGQHSRLCRKAKEQVAHSFAYSYRDHKARKGDFHRLWIQRINTAPRMQGMTYNRSIQGPGLAGVEIDRRILVGLTANDTNTLNVPVKAVKNILSKDVNAPRA